MTATTDNRRRSRLPDQADRVEKVAKEAPTGSDLYRRLIEPEEGFNGISRKVWRHTPWVVDIWTGGVPYGRRRDMWIWCRERWGMPTWPYTDINAPECEGHWHEGGATINGWCWWGFDTEDRMNEFLDAWPNPDTDLNS